MNLPADWYSLQWFSPSVLLGWHYAWPLALYGLGLIPLLFWLRQVLHRSKRQKLSVALLNDTTLARSRTRYLRAVPGVLAGLGLGCLLVALARPQHYSKQLERTSRGIELVLAIDVSDSMTETDMAPSRLENAKNLAIAFVKNRFQDRIGLVAFAGESFFLCPLTTDYDLLIQQIHDIQPGLIPTAGTAIGSALANCINLLRASPTPSRVAVLLTDGDNTGGNLDPVISAQLARAYGIKLYLVGLGRSDIQGQHRAPTDWQTLSRLAGISGGRFYAAPTPKRLAAVFGEIDALEKADIRTRSLLSVSDHHQVYLYWGLAMLLASLLSKSTFMANILED